MKSELFSLAQTPRNVTVVIKDFTPQLKEKETETLLRLWEFGFVPGTKIQKKKSFNTVQRVALESSTSEYAIDKFIANNILIAPLDKDKFMSKKQKQSKSFLSRVKDFFW